MMKSKSFVGLLLLLLVVGCFVQITPASASAESSNLEFSSQVAQLSYETTGNLNKDFSAQSYVASIDEKSDQALSSSYGCSTGCSQGCSQGCSMGCSQGCSQGCKY